jgi:hypothetical protein
MSNEIRNRPGPPKRDATPSPAKPEPTPSPPLESPPPVRDNIATVTVRKFFCHRPGMPRARINAYSAEDAAIKYLDSYRVSAGRANEVTVEAVKG